MCTKDLWSIAVDIAQIASALGTCAAVVVSLWLAGRGDWLRVRVSLTVRNRMFSSTNPSDARFELTNVGERDVFISRVYWRIARTSTTHWMSWQRYGDDEEQGDIYGVGLRHGKPLAILVPYRINVRHIRELLGIEGRLSKRRLKRIRLEIIFTTGRVKCIKIPDDVAREIEAVSGQPEPA
ncbi:hypothetical protein B0G69_0462 [Paraburkholderia sp. RAU2J]|uniref:hypothetical protein n=1 Tax=Paraburkholderia sp. RAU2J TaxID=1938810 RepID=UPI000EABC981|nr:hypothetical protein [Paraburkholderia sp. RAU2J]RKT24773.1 hypothetical protein B0G69_0462 [Paraburkholderia sp. RAU2J]